MTEETDYSLVQKLKLYLAESQEKTKASRDLGIKTRKYYDGDQLPADVVGALEQRAQPKMWENIVLKIGNRVAGLKDSTKTEIAAFRRRVPDKAAANVFTNIIRSTRDFGEWAVNKSAADFDLMIAGLSVMAKKVKHFDEYDMFGHRYHDIVDEHISFTRVWIDPFSNKADYSDARYLTISGRYSKGELYKKFDKELVDRLVYEEVHNNTVADVHMERAELFYTWYREAGVIKWAIWGDGDVVLAKGDSPYKMDRFPFSVRRANKLNPDNPGEYYGMFKNVLPLQDKINFAHLRIANMIGSVKLMFESDAVEDADDFIQAYALDDAVVEVKNGAIRDSKFKEIKHDSKIQQLMSIIEDSRRQAEEIVGLNAELLGMATQRLSGAAIENRQNSGLIGLQQFMNASMEQDKDSAEMTIELASQYLKAEQIYQIMDKKEADAYFIINETVKNPDGSIAYEGGEPKRRNKIEAGHYSVVLRQIPASRGSIAERQKSWAEITKSLTEEQRVAVLPSMLRDVESPVADEVADILKTLEENNAQNNQQQEMMMAELEKKMALMDSKIADFVGKAKENEAQAVLHLAKAEEIKKGKSIKSLRKEKA
jgi:hypothetical protein